MKISKFFAVLSMLAFLVGAIGTFPAIAASGVVRSIPNGGTTTVDTGAFTPSGDGDVTQVEFPGQGDEADGSAGPYPGIITDRSFSEHSANGVSTNSGKKAKSNPTFNSGFEGLNHYQQRYSRGGNQFSLEPPDQGLCVGNGYVVEAVNDVLNVFNTSGQSVLPDNTATNIVAGFPRNVNHAVDLNSFYGYPAAVNRTTGVRGPFVTDPSCLYDAATQRFFVVILTLDVVPTSGAFTGTNHLDIAVSNSNNPTGTWTIYRIPVQDDGTGGTPDHGCPANNDGTGHGPCLGDYPHIGADANGFYITTNEYAFYPDFVYMGAQVYAFSKAQLAAGAANVTMVQFDTSHSGVGGFPGFTVWPAQSPGTTQFNTSAGGTEYLLSSDAGDEAQCESGTPCEGGTGTSTDLLVWKLTNTSSLNSATPSLALSNTVLTVGTYAIPPRQKQPGTGLPPALNAAQGYCLNDETTVTIAGTGCYRLLVSTAVHNATKPEVLPGIDSNDSRMQQVMYANGKLWGALDTALNPDGGPQRAGIAWYIVNPTTPKIIKQGYLGATGYDLTYPAIGVTSSGRGVMAFTATGDTLNPSAAVASIDAVAGVGPWSVVPGGTGAAPDDGFSGYKAQRFPNGIRPRWGDYGAAAVDGNSVWVASEYVGQACNYTDYGGPFFVGGTGDNLLGTCGGASHGPGARTALANWSTRISKFTP
ncbi:MAG: hypothetical protein ACM3MF_00515 [Anaerolineae bacterium]